MIIKFPEQTIEEKIGSRTKKNHILHLAMPYQEINLEIVSNDRTSIVVKDENENQYFLTSNKSNIPDEYQYVSLINKFTQNSIQNGNIEPKKWLKHPELKNYSTDEIISTWVNNFNFKKEDQANNVLGLRNPQIGAIHALMGHLTNAKEIATIVLPTGTGKTETMLSVLVANQCNKLLVTVPSDALRTQLAEKFRSLGLLVKADNNGRRILNKQAKFPKVGIVNTGFDSEEELSDFFNQCNVIISTMNLVAGSPPSQQRKIADLCSHLFIDEAHHSKAGNWDKFIKKFEKKKVVQFTATPYRNDGELLDGKIIYNFTLKEAQEQGYFKTIDFLPIRIYEEDKADIEIARVAVERLREDIVEGKDHILMARCETQDRAESVFKIYEEYEDLNPVVIHAGVRGKNQIKQRIVNKEHKIIVCVDMLGEGFDLPELKVAAFHDIRKSLPITLQFAGRFTRTSRDANLGKASFIANLYQKNLNDEIALLYVKESNWNSILPELSQRATQEQIDLQGFLSGFENSEETTIPYQDIRPAFSTVVYQNKTDDWFPTNFVNGIKGYDNYDAKFFDLNRDKKTLLVFLGKKRAVDWGSFKDVYNIEWNIFIVHWETKKNLLFIHSSEKSGEYKELAKAIIGEDAVLIKDENVFKSFHKLDRIKLYNLGLRKGLGKDISFQSYYGRGVQDGLSQSEEKSGAKNNLFGVAYENGDKTSLGCSQKGRIWSYSRGTINQFIDWCYELGVKLSNPNIDPHQILLKNTIKANKLSERPNVIPIVVDWNSNVFEDTSTTFSIIIQGQNYDLSNTELNIYNPTLDGDLQFSLDTIDGKSIKFTQKLSMKIIDNEKVYDYKIINDSNVDVKIKKGKDIKLANDYFEEDAPYFWFADGSKLIGYIHEQYNEEFLAFPKEEIITWDWTGVNINEESEKFENIVTTSIQYHCFQKLLVEDYDIVFNDDDSGEIADIVTIKNFEESIEVEFYHLKYALEGKVSNQIKNFYEVCGQAQKSLRWKYKDEAEFIHHLIKREVKKQDKNQTRIKKGSIEELESLLAQIKRTKPVNYQIYIVQPALSKQNVSDDILHQLGVTANHIKKEGNINLKVIGSN